LCIVRSRVVAGLLATVLGSASAIGRLVVATLTEFTEDEIVAGVVGATGLVGVTAPVTVL